MALRNRGLKKAGCDCIRLFICLSPSLRDVNGEQLLDPGIIAAADRDDRAVLQGKARAAEIRHVPQVYNVAVVTGPSALRPVCRDRARGRLRILPLVIKNGNLHRVLPPSIPEGSFRVSRDWVRTRRPARAAFSAAFPPSGLALRVSQNTEALSGNLFYQTFFRLFPLEQKKQGFCQNRQGMRRSLRLYFLKKYKKAAGNDFRRHFLRCENVPFHPSGDARAYAFSMIALTAVWVPEKKICNIIHRFPAGRRRYRPQSHRS